MSDNTMAKMMEEILEEIRGLRQEMREQSQRIAALERALAQSGQPAPGGTPREENRPGTIGQAPTRGRAVEISSAPEPRPNIADPTPTTAAESRAQLRELPTRTMRDGIMRRRIEHDRMSEVVPTHYTDEAEDHLDEVIEQGAEARNQAAAGGSSGEVSRRPPPAPSSDIVAVTRGQATTEWHRGQFSGLTHRGDPRVRNVAEFFGGNTRANLQNENMEQAAQIFRQHNNLRPGEEVAMTFRRIPNRVARRRMRITDLADMGPTYFTNEAGDQVEETPRPELAGMATSRHAPGPVRTARGGGQGEGRGGGGRGGRSQGGRGRGSHRAEPYPQPQPSGEGSGGHGRATQMLEEMLDEASGAAEK